MTGLAGPGHSSPMQTSAERREAPVQPASFEALYEAQVDFVWRTVRRLGVPPEGLDDAVQEVFLIVHRRLAEFEPRAKVSTWLFAICLRVVADVRRRHRRKPQPESLSPALVDPAQGPHELTAQAEALRQLDAVLDTLDEKKRAVFVMAEVEQLTVPEMAEVLGENLNTVSSRLRAARQHFEQALARHQARQR